MQVRSIGGVEAGRPFLLTEKCFRRFAATFWISGVPVPLTVAHLGSLWNWSGRSSTYNDVRELCFRGSSTDVREVGFGRIFGGGGGSRRMLWSLLRFIGVIGRQ